MINKITVSLTKINNRSRKTMLHLLIILVAMVTITGWLNTHPNPVMADARLQVMQDSQAELTPTPSPSSTGSTIRTSPVIGILVLLAPLVFLAWKSRGVKEPKTVASCCVPVIDGNKRPFQIQEEEVVAKQSSSK